MLHKYCPDCDWYDEVFQSCSSIDCDFQSIKDFEDEGFLLEEDDLNEIISDFFGRCDEDFR